MLRELHSALDSAVLATYCWPVDITDGEIVALNAERAEEEA